VSVIATLAFVALLLAAAITDVLRLRIPNLIPLALLGGFALLIAIGEVAEPLGHLAAMLIVLALLLPLFAFGMLGGGDVKLLAAAALWLGLADLPLLLLLVGIIGGIFAAFWLPLRWLLSRAVPADRLPPSLQLKAALPYGVPIGIVALVLHLAPAGKLLTTGW
jgi:prepilin peptidase CpaA